MKTAILLTLIGAASCGPWTRPSYDVVIDPAFTHEQRDVIDDALHDWLVRTDGRAVFYATVGTPTHLSPDGVYIAKASASGDCPDGYNLHAFADGNAIGLEYDAPRLSGKVECLGAALDVDPAKQHKVLLHETGHVLGLEHVTDPKVPSVMHPSIDDATPYLTDADLAQFCEVSGRC